MAPSLAIYEEELTSGPLPSPPPPAENTAFIAVGTALSYFAPVVQTSQDGVTWVDRSAAAAAAFPTVVLQGVATDGFRWVAVGYDNDTFGNPVVITSDDGGASWTSQTANPSTNFIINSICWDGTNFVAVGVTSDNITPRVMTSPNGATWTQRTSAPTTDNNWLSVAASALDSPSVVVAVGNKHSTVGPQIMSSLDNGITWTQHTSAWLASNIYSVGGSASLFVAGGVNTGSNARTQSSSNGSTWTAHTDATNDAEWWGVAHGHGIWVIVGVDSNTETDPRIQHSTSGTSWSASTPNPASDTNGIWLRSVAWSDLASAFVTVGHDGGQSLRPWIMRSLDGTTWTNPTSATSDAVLFGVAGA